MLEHRDVYTLRGNWWLKNVKKKEREKQPPGGGDTSGGWGVWKGKWQTTAATIQRWTKAGERGWRKAVEHQNDS